MRSLLYILIFSLCLVACDPGPDPERRLAKTTISTPSEYKLSDFKYDWAIGETMEDYELVISEVEYKKLVDEITSKPFFQYLDTSKVPIYALDNHTNMKKVSETACWYEGKYFYQIFTPDPGALTTVVLKEDSIMTVSYNDL